MRYVKTISLVILVALLLTACGETTPVPTLAAAGAATPTPPKRTAVSKAELGYPSGQWLSQKDLWPAGLPNGSQRPLFGAFVTNDSLPQVLDYYQKKLISLGLAYDPNYGCNAPAACQETYLLDADLTECTPDHKACASTYQIQFLLVNATASSKDDQTGYIPETVYAWAKTAQTLVIFGGGPYRPFTAPPANTTSAALTTSKPSPAP